MQPSLCDGRLKLLLLPAIDQKILPVREPRLWLHGIHNTERFFAGDAIYYTWFDFSLANSDAPEYNGPLPGTAMLAVLANPMLRFFGKVSAARGRFLLYAFAFPGAFALDIITTLAIADWLIEVILVWIASVWGDLQEVRLVAAVGSITVTAGLWSSPPDISSWKGILNRVAAIILMWIIVWVAKRHPSAPKNAAHAPVFAELLAICSSCKAIRTESDRWLTLERYFSANGGVRFTHGLCPHCYAKYKEDV